ncbi:NPCBM/NEW2 domain-containing protein [Neobacillus sp. WH10]|uniref:NPCBM/NEW2 domain-containing protein n=1 Tax=Neobacillus sp. WH10 TaxID=3047873 RepID=UPI0024C20C4B|nr:NPCBM/NEW2 domain-containing protein [Neobacillus sp. WH10]WHY78401.1 NPCBM/NEW2 domain-containing protein [Neobacillus sp. WH10]
MRKVGVFLCLFAMFLSLIAFQPITSSAEESTSDVNEKPKVVPSLREWKGGTGSFNINKKSRIVIDPQYSKELETTAEVFKTDLLDITKHKLSVVTGEPIDGDFYLTLDSSDSGIGEEGYLFEVKDHVIIRANTTTGVFFGTRTALQILVQDAEKGHISKGTARDYPKYESRGFMLDVGRKFFPMSFLKQYVKMMSWYKMNDFQIHLSDNAIFKDNSRKHWDQYSAFRLESETYPELTAKDGHYTKEEFNELEELAKIHGMTITPEIDTPSHALALTKIRPDLVHPNLPVDHLDITRQETIDFIKSVWDEYLELFDAKEIHFGADEFYTGEKETMEIYREYLNVVNEYFKSKGKKARAWGSLSQFPGETPVDKDIVLNIWNNGWHNPVDAVNDGFDVINTNDGLLYMVPFAGYYNDYLNTKLLYEKWEPNIFSINNPKLNIAEDNPHLLGGMFAVWNDKIGYGYTTFDVHDRVRHAMPTLAQKMWSGKGEESFNDFTKLTEDIGEAPGMDLLREVPTKSDLILNYTFDHGKSDHVKDNSGNNYRGSAKGIERTKDGRYSQAAVFNDTSDHISTDLLSKGFPWSTSMWVKLDENKSEGVVLESSDSSLKLVQKDTNKVGFSREGYDFSFDYSLPVGQWVHLALNGTTKGTSLYVNGELRESTNRTLVLPLSTIGSKTKAFKGTLDEFRVYNRPLSNIEIKQLAVASMKNVNVAAFKNVVASSSETSSLTPENAVDEDLQSRWASGYKNNEWIYVDLGEKYTIDSVTLNWEPAYGRGYEIQVSQDAENWSTVYSTTTGDGGIDEIQFNPVEARYVRMYGTERATSYGYSLWEFEVYQAESSSSILLSLDSSKKMIVPGQTAQISAVVQNKEPEEIRDVRTELKMPEGWTVKPISETEFTSLSPEEKVEVKWEVTAPEDAQEGSVDFFSEVSFAKQGKEKTGYTRTPMTVEVTPQPPTKDAFISDLSFFGNTENGWGPIEKDRSNGESGDGDGNRITLNGVTYDKGLGVHAYSEASYFLGGNVSTFSADIGVDDEVSNRGSIVFQVWADGEKIYDSGLMTGDSATKQVNANVIGKNVLKLVVTDGGNGAASDHGNWANARITIGK